MARQTEKTVETETVPKRYSTFNNNHGWLYGLLGLVILVIVFMAGVGIANHRHGVNFGSGKIIGGSGGRFGGMGAFGRRSSLGGGGFGGTATNNGQSRTSGVVTSVNGSSFTLAGNGLTTNVTTSSSTQYQDGNQVKQNDSVIVFGTTSNGNLDATQIIINP